MIDPTTHALMSQARMRMLLKDPFFGRLALHLDLREEPGVPTLATDGSSIYYNPAFMRKLNNEQRASEVAHEVSHCMLLHFARRGGRDPHRWNIATDYVVNLILKEAGYVVSSDWLYDIKYVGMTAEQVYDLLPQDLSQVQPQCQLIDNKAAPPPEQQMLSWQIAVQAAAVAASKAGAKLPASIERMLDELRHPSVPWREVLRRWMCEKINDDYSWSRPNRKFAPHGLYLPAMQNEGMGTLGVVVDTSGSITNELFNTFMGTLQDVCNQARPRTIVYMAADAEVHETEVIDGCQLDVKQLKATGGGGTAFDPALKAMEDHEPQAVIYLTDLYGSYSEPPSYPVLWACITDQVARWGETIHIEA